MNHPGTTEGNWNWRFAWDQVEPGRLAWFRSLAIEMGRLPGD
jgi:4-alpha-glucanotransferase